MELGLSTASKPAASLSTWQSVCGDTPPTQVILGLRLCLHSQSPRRVFTPPKTQTSPSHLRFKFQVSGLCCSQTHCTPVPPALIPLRASGSQCLFYGFAAQPPSRSLAPCPPRLSCSCPGFKFHSRRWLTLLPSFRNYLFDFTLFSLALAILLYLLNILLIATRIAISTLHIETI